MRSGIGPTTLFRRKRVEGGGEPREQHVTVAYPAEESGQPVKFAAQWLGALLIERRAEGAECGPGPAYRDTHVVHAVGVAGPHARIVVEDGVPLRTQVGGDGVARAAAGGGCRVVVTGKAVAERLLQLRRGGGQLGADRTQEGFDSVEDTAATVDELDLEFAPVLGAGTRLDERRRGHGVVGDHGEDPAVAVEHRRLAATRADPDDRR